MKRNYVLTLLIIIFLVAGFILILPTNKQNKESSPILVGAILPLSGDLSAYGEQERKGIELALEEVNKAGIQNKQIRVLYEDSAGDKSQAVAAYQKLKQLNDIRYLFTCCSGMTLALSPLIEEDKTITFSIAAHPDIIKNPYIFRNLPTAQNYAEALRPFVQEQNIDTIGMLYVNDDFGNGVKDAFVKTLTGFSLFSETYTMDEKSFQTLIFKITSKNPNAIIAIGQGKTLGLLVKQIREAGFTGQLLSTAEFNFPNVTETADTAAEGVIFSDFYADYEQNDIAKTFQQNYVSRYKTEPGFDSILGYNEVLILADALQKPKNPLDTDQVLHELKSNLNASVIGGTIKDLSTQEVKYQLKLKTIKNGKAALLIP